MPNQITEKLHPIVINGKEFAFDKKGGGMSIGAPAPYAITDRTWKSNDGSRKFVRADANIANYNSRFHNNYHRRFQTYSIFTPAESQRLQDMLEQSGEELSHIVEYPGKEAKLKVHKWESDKYATPSERKRIESVYKKLAERRFSITAEIVEGGFNLEVHADEPANLLNALVRGGRTKPDTLSQVAEGLLTAIQEHTKE